MLAAITISIVNVFLTSKEISARTAKTIISVFNAIYLSNFVMLWFAWSMGLAPEASRHHLVIARWVGKARIVPCVQLGITVLSAVKI